MTDIFAGLVVMLGLGAIAAAAAAMLSEKPNPLADLRRRLEAARANYGSEPDDDYELAEIEEARRNGTIARLEREADEIRRELAEREAARLDAEINLDAGGNPAS